MLSTIGAVIDGRPPPLDRMEGSPHDMTRAESPRDRWVRGLAECTAELLVVLAVPPFNTVEQPGRDPVSWEVVPVPPKACE